MIILGGSSKGGVLMNRLWIAALAVGVATFAVGSMASAFDATEDLEGKVVVAAGTVQTISCPPSGKYNCSTWPMDLLEFPAKQVCFTAQSRCSFSCKGFIAVGADKVPYFFQTETIGDGLRKSRVEYFQCPQMY